MATNTRFSETGGFNIKYSTTNQLKHLFFRFGAKFGTVFLKSIQVLPKHNFKNSLHQLLLKQPLLTPSLARSNIF